ncbi:MAG: OmpW/AlkL family protein [Planctomycetota bacterium]
MTVSLLRLGDILVNFSIVSESPLKRQSGTVAHSEEMNKERKEGTHERCTTFCQSRIHNDLCVCSSRNSPSSSITVIGGKAEVDDSITGDVDFSYFFCSNVAAELTLAVSEHDVKATNTLVGNIDLGDVKLLPPTLTLQYHFIPDGKIRPYIGAGVNYTVFFDDDPGDARSIDYDNAFGFALQAGVDIGINENWAINLDVKKIWLETDVSVKALATTVKTDVDIDPWLFGIGLAYRW